MFDGTGILPGAPAVIIYGGGIEAVVPVADVPSSVHVVRLPGAFLMPGITDSHIHVASLGESMLNVDLSSCASAAECARLVGEAAAARPPGEWIVARGWRASTWADDSFPSAALLDAHVPRNPVFCRSFDGHSVWVNSRALSLAGVSSGTPDPPGGIIGRGPSGAPAGVLRENAIELVRSAVPQPTPAERRESIRRAQSRLNSLGVTGVHDVNGFSDFALAAEMARSGELTVRFSGACGPDEIAAARDAAASAPRDSLAGIAGVKLFADGSINSRTCALFEPFEGTQDTGVMTIDPAGLADAVRTANAAGLPVFVHAIGDRAVSSVLDAVMDHGVAAVRNRVEHAALIGPGDVSRMAAMHVTASMQPSHIVTDIAPCERYLGDRCGRAYVFRSLLDAGVVLAFGTDAPVVSADPRHGIFAAVARTGFDLSPPGGWYPAQKLAMAEALTAFCRGAAISIGRGSDLGRIAPGFAADITVLGVNPLGVEPAAVLEIPVHMTVVSGRIVFSVI